MLFSNYCTKTIQKHMDFCLPYKWCISIFLLQTQLFFLLNVKKTPMILNKNYWSSNGVGSHHGTGTRYLCSNLQTSRDAVYEIIAPGCKLQHQTSSSIQQCFPIGFRQRARTQSKSLRLVSSAQSRGAVFMATRQQLNVIEAIAKFDECHAPTMRSRCVVGIAAKKIID